MNTFDELGLTAPLLKAVSAEGYEIPTPIQLASIPHLLHGGDLLGSAQTGTGKTASFAIPVLQQLAIRNIRSKSKQVSALVLTPTRELALQVADSFKRYGKFTNLKTSAVFGGVGYGPQIKTLRSGVDILVATPGRLLDLLDSGHVRLDKVEHFILDEADRMFDMGFRKDLEKIQQELPEKRQTLLFSATMPKEIEKLASRILNNPKRVSIEPKKVSAVQIEDRVIFIQRDKKHQQLVKLLSDSSASRTIVFTRTKHVAEKLSKKLSRDKIRAEAIHGNKSQNQRQRSLERFKKGKVQVLVATDVAARGIDVADVSHVINFQLSNEPESYVHRIGRTARAGKSGAAITLCDSDESPLLLGVEKLLKRKVETQVSAEFFDEEVARAHLDSFTPKASRKRESNSRGGRRRGPASRRKRHRGQKVRAAAR